MTNKNEQRKVPELRFPEFSGEWEENKLSDSIQLLKSGLSRQLSNEDIGYPVIRANNLQNGKLDLTDLKFWFKDDPQGANTENYFVEKNDILINFINSESKMGTSCIINEPLYRKMIYTTNILRYVTKKGFHPYFHYTYTFTSNYKKWIKIITKPAVNQASFTTVDFKNIPYLVPSFNEQQKIGEFFSKLDRQIELEEKKLALLEEQKKGYMQKIFSQELRFKDENGEEYPEWRKEKLINISEVTSCTRVKESEWTSSGIPFYRARDIVKIINGEEVSPIYISYETYKNKIKKNGEVKEGDLIITGVGSIGVPFLMPRDKKIYFKDGNTIWIKKNKINSDYLYYYFLIDSTQKYIKNTSGKGTVGTFTIENAKNTPIIFPNKSEQLKIVSMLDSIITNFNSQKSKVELLKKRKKALINRLLI